MIVNKNEDYTSYINPDTNVLANFIHFSIFEHAYFEFDNEVVAIHSNKLFANNNTLYYVIEGGGTIFMKDKEIPILPGKIYFYPCVKNEEYKSVFIPGTKKIHIKFFCNLYSDQDVFSNIYYPQELDDTYNLMSAIKETILSKNPGKQAVLTPLIYLSIAPLFTQVKEFLSEQLIKAKKYSHLFDFVDKNLYIDLTTEKIARKTGFSTYMLTHTIPREMGFTIKKYITNKLIQLVCFDLVYTETLIRSIAERYHFSTEGYFSDWFFKQTEMRPKEYRQQFRPNGNYSFYQNHI